MTETGCSGCATRGSGGGDAPLPISVAGRSAIVALVGNPNTGKTSLFNALTGYRRHVANYPGVTVELARGPIRGAARSMELLDLPGTYSLAAQSPDEQIVCDALCGRIAGAPRPDVALAVLDASNLHRNFYLLSQLLELELPVVVALNMVDVARARGVGVDHEELSRRLGIPVVPVIAIQPLTLRPLLAALVGAIGSPPSAAAPILLPEVVERSVTDLQAIAAGSLRRGEALRLLIDSAAPRRRSLVAMDGLTRAVSECRDRIVLAGLNAGRAEVQARYGWASRVLAGAITRPAVPVRTWSDRIDAVLTHKFWGALVLVGVLFAVFQSIFVWANPLMGTIESGFGAFAEWLAPRLPGGALRSLATDGLIAGVGGVLVFLPQIVILFALIAILEDCGYMSRAAYLMDRLMRIAGLSGRSLIPLLSAFACAVPAIMGTRTIANRRERMVTLLIAPFMSCSARLPVYTLMIAAFVPNDRYFGGWVGLQGLVMMAMYLAGVLVAIPLAWLLRRTAFRGDAGGFMLELPSYKMPRLRAIGQRITGASREFLARAGTVILLVNMIVWALSYFPRPVATRLAVETEAAASGWDAQQTQAALAGEYLRGSYLGTAGRWIEPVVAPIGWDWRIGVAVIASFPAREVVIATLGTVYNLADVDEESASLHAALKRATWAGQTRRVFDLPVALSLMVFFALCAQCSSTLVMIGRETRSWLWPLASFASMTLIAYVAAWLTASVARAAGL